MAEAPITRGMSRVELREALGRWLFERNYRERGLCQPEDAEWEEWVERNREEWREEADALLAWLQEAALRG